MVGEDKQLFMDVVLLLSHEIGAIHTKVFEWLGMVHKHPIEDVVKWDECIEITLNLVVLPISSFLVLELNICPCDLSSC